MVDQRNVPSLPCYDAIGTMRAIARGEDRHLAGNGHQAIRAGVEVTEQTK
jgi:hypothetical protein